MKKIIFFIVIVLAVFGFSACKQNEVKTDGISANIAMEVQETGTIIDITNKTGQIVYAKPGDILSINFIDTKNSKNQWSLRSALEHGVVSLKNHNIISEKDARIKEGEALNEWNFKILREGNFEIVFAYKNALKPSAAIKTFRVEIVSGKRADEIPDIIINAPKPGESATQKLQIRGYSKSANKTLRYKFLDSRPATTTVGMIIIGNDTSYFEKTLDIQKANQGAGNLFLYQTNEQDNSEFNSISIPITVNKEK